LTGLFAGIWRTRPDAEIPGEIRVCGRIVDPDQDDRLAVNVAQTKNEQGLRYSVLLIREYYWKLEAERERNVTLK
jgi:hypothetical protein